MILEEGGLNYSNAVGLTFSQIDFVLEFSLDVPISTEAGVEVQRRQVARIALSPPQAGALSRLLSADVAQYEERYGQLPHESQLEPSAEQAAPASAPADTGEGATA